MSKKTRRILLITALVLIIEISIAAIFTYNYLHANFYAFGKMGKTVYYAVNTETKTALIYGIGAMRNYQLHFFGGLNAIPKDDISPFDYPYMEIKTIIISEGVTYISECAFQDCYGLETIYIPKSVDEINLTAFMNCQNIETVYFCGNSPTFPDGLMLWEEASIIHQPNSTGWDDPIWEEYNIVEEDFTVPYPPA